MTVCGNANVNRNTATLAMMIALTAGVIGPGPKATLDERGVGTN
jgi:hypothetical protein